MPSPYRGERPYPRKEWTLKHAADVDQIVTCRCALCKKEVRYLAADLLQFFSPARDALEPPFACSCCNHAKWVRVTLTYAMPGDVGVMVLRRPGAVRRVQTWRWVKLGER